MSSLKGNMGQQEFEALYKAHFKFLCNFAKQYVRDLETAEDICQLVFIKLWENRDSIDPNKSIKALLFTSCKNRCLNYIRDNKKFESQILDIDCGDLEFGNFEDHLEAEELKVQIDKILEALPEKCRQVFEMSRFEQLKYKEIAEKLGIAQKTVEAHMSKALKTLSTGLKDYYFHLILFLNFFEF